MNDEQRCRLEKVLGYVFVAPDFLRAALTHRSHRHEHERHGDDDYERLEFLGDALLGFVVAEWLFADDPASPEGVLSRRRQSVVRAATLAKISQRLDLGEAIRLAHRLIEKSGPYLVYVPL